MNRKVLGWAFVIALALLSVGIGSTPGTATVVSPQGVDPAAYLPASDAVAIIDVRRLLNETMPRVLAGDAAKLAQANADIDKFKTRTGVDPRTLDRTVIGSAYTYPAPKVTKLETVAIARGTFDQKAIVAAARAKGKYREEKYHGVSIEIVTVNDDIRLLGIWNVRLNEVAIGLLDQNTLAIGTLNRVHAAIDTGKQGGKNVELMALASHDPNAVVGFGANLSQELLGKLNIGNDTIAKDTSSIRQVYGSIGSTQADVSMHLVARTDSEESAKNLGDTVEGLKQLAGIFVPRLTPDKRVLAQNALDSLKITTHGTELELRIQVALANLATVIK